MENMGQRRGGRLRPLDTCGSEVSIHIWNVASGLSKHIAFVYSSLGRMIGKGSIPSGSAWDRPCGALRCFALSRLLYRLGLLLAWGSDRLGKVNFGKALG